MKRAVPNRQRDLFEIEDPPTEIPPERQAKLLPLLQALLMETLTGGMAVAQEGDHDQDHA